LVGFPANLVTAHGLALALEDLCCFSVLRSRPVQAPSVRSGPPPLRSFASSALPVRGIHFPARPSSRGSHPGLPAPPRRGLPHPLRSASVVFHDPGGLLLPEPCGVFQPLTPVRFVSLFPRAEARGDEVRPATACYRCRGPGPPGRVLGAGEMPEHSICRPVALPTFFPEGLPVVCDCRLGVPPRQPDLPEGGSCWSAGRCRLRGLVAICESRYRYDS
jgi:hypothetical protein